MSAPRVFISYSQDATEPVRTLVERLEQRDVSVIWDRGISVPERGWPIWCKQQIRDADLVLCICTATYYAVAEGLESPGSGRGAGYEARRICQVIYDADGRNTKFAPVLVDGSSYEDVPDDLRPTTRYDVREESGVTALLDRIHTLARKLERARQLEAELASELELELAPEPHHVSVSPAPRPSGVLIGPPRARFSIDRSKLHAKLSPAPDARGRWALVGDLGVGKTALSVEHLHRAHAVRPWALWTQAGSGRELISELCALARRLGLVSASARPGAAAERMSRWLEETEGWLLVVDGVRDVRSVIAGLPPVDARGQVVLVSDRSDGLAEAGFTEVPVEPFTLGETADMLRARIGAAGDELARHAQRLHEATDGRVAALSTIVAEAQHWGGTLERPLGRLHDDRPPLEQLIGRDRMSPTPASHALDLAVALPAHPIPVEVLTAGRTPISVALDDGTSELAEALAPLLRRELATLDDGLLRVNAAARDAAARTLNHSAVMALRVHAALALNASFPEPAPTTWTLCDRLLPHALQAATTVRDRGMGWNDAGALLTRAGVHLRIRGEYADAQRLLLQAVDLAGVDPSVPPHDRARIYDAMSDLLRDCCLAPRALTWIAQAIEIAGPDIPKEEVARRHAEHAAVLVLAGRGPSAEAAAAIDAARTCCSDAPSPVRAQVHATAALVAVAHGRSSHANALAREASRAQPAGHDGCFPGVDDALGLAALSVGDPAAALETLDRAIERREAHLGTSHGSLVAPLRWRSDAHAALGRTVSAAADAGRAERLREAAVAALGGG